MTRLSLTTLVMAACGVLALSGPSHAALTSWEEVTVSSQLTDYTQSVTLTKFDTSLGTLQAVSLRLIGEVTGNIRFENLDATSAATITARLSATLRLEMPLNTVLASVAPEVLRVETVSEWDGLIDFVGTSGRSFLNQTATAGPVYHNTAIPADLAFYSGPGTFGLTLRALANSSSTGSGNLTNAFSTSAGGTVAVQYEYEPTPTTTPVPEPGSLALFGLGGAALGLTYRRRLRSAARGA